MSDINKAVTMLYTKDDCGAFCDLHTPVIETGEIGAGRGEFLRKEPLTFHVDCAMCKAISEIKR